MMRATLHLASARDYPRLRPGLQPSLSQALSVLGDRAAGLDLTAVLPVARRLLAAGSMVR